MIWTREQTRALTDRVLSLSKAEETFVAVSGSERASVRFARNTATTSGATTAVSLAITASVSKRSGSVTTAQFDDASLQRALKSAEEIARVLKPGGLVFVETHFSFSSHERPWHFFQFSDMALRALFSPALGFECVEAAMQNPIVGRFSAFADAYLRFQPVRALYCHSNIVARKVRDVPDFSWREAGVKGVAGEAEYPAP